jgi:hypothetical protein
MFPEGMNSLAIADLLIISIFQQIENFLGTQSLFWFFDKHFPDEIPQIFRLNFVQ